MRFKIGFLAWLIVATVAGAIGLPAKLRPPMPQIVLLCLTAALVAAGSFWPAFRGWLCARSWKAIVSIHLSRFIGFYFLWLYGRGQLPYAFAVPAGLGDIIVAMLAAGLLGAAGTVSRHPWLLLAWNVIGFADIAMVVLRAATVTLRNPDSMAALLRLPLSLLITFLVPIIIGSHVLLFARLRAKQWRVA